MAAKLLFFESSKKQVDLLYNKFYPNGSDLTLFNTSQFYYVIFVQKGGKPPPVSLN